MQAAYHIEHAAASNMHNRSTEATAANSPQHVSCPLEQQVTSMQFLILQGAALQEHNHTTAHITVQPHCTAGSIHQAAANNIHNLCPPEQQVAPMQLLKRG
jgi:hypothetical protein